MTNQFIFNRQAPILAAILVFTFLCASCGIALPGSKPAVLPFIPPPEGAFPAQLGNLKLKAEPVQAEYSTAESKSYTAYYTSPQKSEVEYRLKIFSAPRTKPADVPYGLELLNDSGATKVYFAVGLESLFVLADGDGGSLSANALSIADANEILKNIPYQVLKAAPPAQPILITLPPASFVEKKQPVKEQKTKEAPEVTKALDEADEKLREFSLSLVKMWFKKNGGFESAPRVNKLDPSTLMTNPKGVKDENASNLADKLKKDLGKNLKDVGFRQFVLSPDLVKLD